MIRRQEHPLRPFSAVEQKALERISRAQSNLPPCHGAYGVQPLAAPDQAGRTPPSKVVSWLWVILYSKIRRTPA